MKARANLERMSLVLLGVVLCFADFVSAAQRSGNLNTSSQRTGAVKGQLTATFGNHCSLPSPIAEFKLSEEHKEVRLFSVPELRQIPIPEVYVWAVKLALLR